jgi:tetraprenyl-beta-curcumene synthase
MRAGPAVQFARAASIFWLDIFPQTFRERRAWSQRAAAIPDPALRHDAELTLRTKWGHAEGAAAFATLVPRAYRRRFVRMAVAYELLVDYLDTTSERPVDDAYANTFRLHQALHAALGIEPFESGDCYALHPHREDGGYVAAQIDICREIFASFPSSKVVAGAAQRLATLYAEAQGLYHAIGAGAPDIGRAKYTQAEAGRNVELQWGEMLAAGASTLPTFALLALATEPGLSEGDAELVASAYYPWVSSLHILLHGLVDQDGDRASGQINQLDHYRSPEEATERICLIASRAQRLVAGLPQGDLHAAIFAGMGGYYLAPSQLWTAERTAPSRRILDCMGPLAKTALQVHGVRSDGRLRMGPANRAKLRTSTSAPTA